MSTGELILVTFIGLHIFIPAYGILCMYKKEFILFFSRVLLTMIEGKRRKR
jgi:hypothetical protein